MKKCPNCDKTFEDSMRFCQVDGTLLVDDAPAFDPYATIVGQAIPPIETASETEPDPESESAPAEDPTPEIHQTVSSVPISEPEDVLDLPSVDPLKTMYVSESELSEAMTDSSADQSDNSAPTPEPPSFITPDEPEPESPAFEAPAPPPSPFSAPEPVEDSFKEAATMVQQDFTPAYDPAPVQDWTPPPVPDANWQDQQLGSNTPFQPPVTGVDGENKTLAIVSLVAGILGTTLCCGALLPSMVAIVTGIMARNKVKEDPAQYGGAGMALGGLITGIVGLVLGIVVIILQVVLRLV